MKWSMLGCHDTKGVIWVKVSREQVVGMIEKEKENNSD